MKNRQDYLLGVIGFALILLVAWSMFRLSQALDQGLTQYRSVIAPMQGITQKMGTQIAQIANPTPTIIPDPITIIHSVRSLARLETIQYSVEKVITAESGNGPFGFLFGDRLLLVAHGIVIAGIDMEKLRPADFQLENGILTIDIPEAEIFLVTLDNEKTYVYDRETGLLSKGNIHLESDARRAAEDSIRQAAIADGILDLAKSNAEAYLIRLFLQLGYRDVIFR